MTTSAAGPKLALSRTAHRTVFALWVFAPGRSAAVWRDIALKDFHLLPPRGRMNASTADHAEAWFQGTDRLETARDRPEPFHSPFRDHNAGPPPQGRSDPRGP